MHLLIAAVFMISGSPLTPHAAAVARPGDFGWPLAGRPEVRRHFETPPHDYGPGHRGADLVGAPGQPVLAAGDGIVAHAGWLVDRNVVSVEHPGGLRTTYEPVTPTVRAGQQVNRGDVIGAVDPGHPGCTARPRGACLHWGARRGRQYLNPLRLTASGHVRLLPWEEAVRPAP